ncbi:hypothetical protein CVT91_13615 [Candidatus Atribacteria bacterium HGW-Atribacteria-1]|nr:MAG: hypothetical protein CVT91_13615 [Candidatus Atribacteria bacterium HGW-Atribacteria-1]
MKIKTKLYASAILYIGLISLLAVLLLFFSFREKEELVKSELINEFAKGIAELSILTDEYIAYKETRMEQQWQWKYIALSEILEKPEELIELNIVRSAFESLNDSFSFLTTNYREMQELLRKNVPKEELERTILLEERVAARMRMETQKLITLSFDVAENSRQRVNAIQQRENLILLFLSISMILFVAVITVRIAGGITKCIDELIMGAERIGRGQLDYHIQVTAKDETAVLANTFNEMAKKIAGMIETEREVKVEERTKKLQEANIKLQELDRLKSMFIASMSHELRTPLNSIIGFTGIILQGMSGKITEDQRKELTMVKNSANHLLVLINDVIDVSKIEAGKVELVIEEFNLADLMQEVKDSFKIATDEKDLKLSLEMPERLIIKSDERRTKQVIMNLVSNAVKFTDRGEIEMKVKKKDERVKVSVADTGIGIKKENMEKLFKQFSRIYVEGKPVTEGTGLGLYLSKKIVDLLGGQIKAGSEFGKGSMFTFTFPLKYTEVKT